MPLIQKDIEAKVTELVTTLTSGDPATKEPEQTKREFIEGLSKLIIDAIKTADVTIATGLIQVQGSPSAQSNLAPIKIVGGLS